MSFDTFNLDSLRVKPFQNSTKGSSSSSSVTFNNLPSYSLVTPPPTPGGLSRGTNTANKRDRAAPSPSTKLPLNSKVVRLRQLQYRSWKYTVSIYHFSVYLSPLQAFKNTLTRAEHGWQYSSTGPDPLHDIRDFPVPEGDEMPPGRLEVAYLPNIFQGKGSAIGFRDHEHNTIEWLCFSNPSEEHIAKAQGQSGESLFDKVAELEKGGKGEKGHPEHRAWFESVQHGARKSVRLKLTWKRAGNTGAVINLVERREKW